MGLTKKKKVIIGSIATVIVLIIAGGIAAVIESRDSDHVNFTSSVTVPKTVKVNAEDDNDAVLAARAKITAEQAGEHAAEAVPGKVIGIDLELEKGNLVYEVDVVTSTNTTEVVIDAGNGRVLAKKAERDGDDAAFDREAKITAIQAARKATEAVPGKVIEVEADDDDGMVRYEVDVVTAQGTIEVIVDARSGAVVFPAVASAPPSTAVPTTIAPADPMPTSVAPSAPSLAAPTTVSPAAPTTVAPANPAPTTVAGG